MKISQLVTLLALFNSEIFALDNGLAQRPQMGWNTWNKYGCGISEDLIKSTAKLMVDMGLVDLGYEYMNLDDCWQQHDRAADGHIQVSEAFPSGMAALGDYLHSLGMKFGLYSSAGIKTCEGRAGGLGYEMIDAHDYAKWGVDYLKYDNCFNEQVPALDRYPKMRDALNSTGRPIFYSLCQWGEEDTLSWAASVGNSWRTTQDIDNSWAALEYNFRLNQYGRGIAGPGGWNDPDMLEVGNHGLTYEEEKTHFALWALAKAPLIIGCDLAAISKETLSIIANKDLIAINQDPGAEQVRCVMGCTWWDTFLRSPSAYLTKTSAGKTVVAVVNWREVPFKNFTFKLSDIEISPQLNEEMSMKDLYENKKMLQIDDPSNVDDIKIESIPGHGIKVLEFSSKSKEPVIHAPEAFVQN